MVRFIIITACVSSSIKSFFTFQYGLIYYKKPMERYIQIHDFYIPIWLDLLLNSF